MDDFMVYGNDIHPALYNLKKILIRCRENNLSLNHEKSKMMFNEGIFLGHHISGMGIRVDPSKIEIISRIKILSSQKEITGFLGHDGYYRRFIQNFTKLDAPLFKLLSKDVEFHWDPQCQIAFEILK
jgi:hypothetical protein